MPTVTNAAVFQRASSEAGAACRTERSLLAAVISAIACTNLLLDRGYSLTALPVQLLTKTVLFCPKSLLYNGNSWRANRSVILITNQKTEKTIQKNVKLWQIKRMMTSSNGWASRTKFTSFNLLTCRWRKVVFVVALIPSRNVIARL